MPGLRAKARRAGAMTVAVVDPRPADYAGLPLAVNRSDIQWRFVVTGREALRLARTERADLWVVNTVLPDLSGIDLCSMLRDRSPRPAVFVVADVCRAEDERAARGCGATLFGCKPVPVEWFDFLQNPIVCETESQYTMAPPSQPITSTVQLERMQRGVS